MPRLTSLAVLLAITLGVCGMDSARSVPPLTPHGAAAANVVEPSGTLDGLAGRYFTGPLNELVYVPASAGTAQPARVLVALHGLGNEAATFCRGLLADAERNGWVLVAPRMRYRPDWANPASVASEDGTAVLQLRQTLDALPGVTGLRLRQRVLLYGFSRGGQVAHRFALAYPRKVLAVAALSAGTYTLPETEWPSQGAVLPLPLPFGTADLERYTGQAPSQSDLKGVTFWLSVGANDNRDADVPSAWTPYIGSNRLTRARAFVESLRRRGVSATLTVYPAVGHAETAEMRSGATTFLRRASLASRLTDAAGS